MKKKKKKEIIQGISSGKSGLERPHHNTVASSQHITAHYRNCPVWNPMKKDKFFTVVSI